MGRSCRARRPPAGQALPSTAVRPTWTAAVAALTAFALVAGCADDKTSTVTAPTAAGSATTTSVAASTTATTEVSAADLKAALLTPDDLPGATVSTAPSSDFDLATCVQGNSFAVKTDPSEVKGPGLELADGDISRSYGSKARRGTPDQAKAFVTAFGSAAGSSCVLEAFKSRLSADPTPPKVDVSGLTGTAATAAVADGGSSLSIKGTISAGTQVVPVDTELLVFQRGALVVYVSAGASGGAKIPGQALELAQKIAGRLS